MPLQSRIGKDASMRNQQNKRMRGRNRKSHNPLTRVYESNGPDVKIRGTASHVAEKYLQLARDAQSSGDPVSAENYLQHAEHYFRMIAAAQEQFRQTAPFFRGEGGMDGRDETRDDMGDDGDDEPAGLPGRASSRPSVPGIRSPICHATRSSSSLASNRVSAVVNRNTSRPRVAMTAMWNACLPSSPAARPHRKSHHSRRTRVMVRTASRDRATVSRCTGGGAGIAARAAI